MPLEAPFEATRGWNIISLNQGVSGLSDENAASFALFCRYFQGYRLCVDSGKNFILNGSISSNQVIG